MFGNLRSLLGLSGGGSVGSRLASWDLGKEQKEGERLFEEADYAGAELHLARAVEGERGHESPEQRILLRLELGEAQRRQYQTGAASQKLVEAEETVRSAVDLAMRSGDRELSAQTLDALLTITAERGDLDEAENLLRQLEALEAKRRRRDPLQRAQRLHCVGLLRQRHGRFHEAVEFLTECAAVHEQSLGDLHPSTAQQFSDLGAAHHAAGNHAETQRCLRRAIRIHERHEGLDSPAAAVDLRTLTESLEASGDIAGAAAEFERVLTAKLRMMGQDLDGIAETQWELAHRYLEWGNNSRARELLLEAVATFERAGGVRLARGYEALAQLEEDNTCYPEALRLRKRAGRVWDSLPSEHMLEAMENLERQILLLELLGQPQEAAFLREQLTAQRA
jgi:tetratricopeptide (TPR) repeat protein